MSFFGSSLLTKDMELGEVRAETLYVATLTGTSLKCSRVSLGARVKRQNPYQRARPCLAPPFLLITQLID